MKTAPIYKLSGVLAGAAGLATILGLLIYNRFAWIYGVSELAIIVIALIVSTVTLIMSLTGLSLHRTYNYSRKKAVFIGAVFGTIAFFLSVFVAMIFIANPKYYSDTLSLAIPSGFVLGGFLGPVMGAIVGYKLTG